MLRRLPFLFFLAMAALLGSLLYLESPAPTSREGKPFPAITLTSFYHDSATSSVPAVKVVNVFATWCTPCVAEMPFLQEIKQIKGVHTIGIAWSEKDDNLSPFFEKYGNPFHTVYNDAKGTLGVELGIRGIPETYVVDAEGMIRFHHIGPITQENLPELLHQIRSLTK